MDKRGDRVIIYSLERVKSTSPVMIMDCYLEHVHDLTGWGHLAKLLHRSKNTVRKIMKGSPSWYSKMSKQFAANRRREHQEVKEALLMYLCLLAEDLGRTPNENDLREYGDVSHAVYFYHFGSFIKAQVLAGLPPNQVGQWGHRNTFKVVRPQGPQIDRVHRLRQGASGFQRLQHSAA